MLVQLEAGGRGKQRVQIIAIEILLVITNFDRIHYANPVRQKFERLFGALAGHGHQ